MLRFRAGCWRDIERRTLRTSNLEPNLNTNREERTPKCERQLYFTSFRIYASSLSFSYFTVLRKRLSSR